MDSRPSCSGTVGCLPLPWLAVRARLPSSAAKGRAVPHLHLHRTQLTPVDTKSDLHPTVRRRDDEGSHCALGQL
jgi:hypothetical protein